MKPKAAQTFIATKEEDNRNNWIDLPENADPNTLVPMYISSRGRAVDTEKIDGVTRKVITGQIIGEKDGKDFVERFKVECDKQIEVPLYIAQHLDPNRKADD